MDNFALRIVIELLIANEHVFKIFIIYFALACFVIFLCLK